MDPITYVIQQIHTMNAILVDGNTTDILKVKLKNELTIIIKYIDNVLNGIMEKRRVHADE